MGSAGMPPSELLKNCRFSARAYRTGEWYTSAVVAADRADSRKSGLVK